MENENNPISNFLFNAQNENNRKKKFKGTNDERYS